MKHAFQKKLFIMMLTIASYSYTADCPPSTDCPVAPMLSIRSQSRDRVHQMVESVGHVHCPYEKQWYSSLSAMLVYEKSFNPNKITECLFGSALECQKGSKNKFIKIQGSAFLGDDRDPKALLADYFYLPRDFESTVSFEPTIRTIMADFDYYVDLSDYYSGLYMRVHGPIVHTNWKLNMCENVIATGTLGYPHGYFTPGALSRDLLLQGFTEYAHGCMPCPLTQDSVIAPYRISVDAIVLISAGQTFTFSPISTNFQGLKYGTMKSNSGPKNCNVESKTGLAEIRAELGRRFIDEDDYHFGVDIQCAIPTGPHKTSSLLFGPQIGNGHHWELGVGVHGHWNFWQDEEKCAVAGLYIDANITHLFNSHQIRTFDLKNRPLSRYQLAMQFTPAVSSLLRLNGTNIIVPDGMQPTSQFNGQFAPVANITTLNVNVSANVQADIVAMVNYNCNNWSFDIGYNFWARSCENISCRTTCCPDLQSVCDPLQENRWAIKGDARVYGYNQVRLPGLPFNYSITPVALSATQNCATIHQGNNQVTLNFLQQDVNPNIDNPHANNPVAAGVGFTPLHLGNGAFSTNQSIPIKTSIEPILIQCNDIDLVGTRGISNKIFAHASHTNNYDTWRLHCGIGGSAEFGKTDKCCDTNSKCKTDCNSSCINCAVSQWSIWGKVGIDFN